MKNLLVLFLMLFSVNSWAACTFDATQPQIRLLDENKQAIEGVSKSNTPLKAGTKASRVCESDICYGRYDGDIKFTYVCDDEPVEPPLPVSCPEGFTGIEPNCEPLPITCELPYVLNVAENKCYTSDATCQDAGWDEANDDLSGCTNLAPIECTPPLVVIPDASNPLGKGSCGCPPFHNEVPPPEMCEPFDMGGDPSLPAVDISLEAPPAVGQDAFNIGDALSWYNPDDKSGTNEGDFRLNCNYSHMANDDPIVYPNQQGASHHHTFFGNTDAYYDADVGNMDTFGNSTCNGGTANRSAYWLPSMIDTATGRPIKPDGIGVYYKTQRASDVTVPPKGLRIIARGFAETDFMCNEDYGGRGIDEIVSCGMGGQLRYGINFPNCWDGVNLDSPDHMEHMRYVVWDTACPASHPVRIPNITINVFYNVTTPAGTSNWRLASDPDNVKPGSTNHADWVNGWDTDTITAIINNCLKGEQDCHSDLIGDGRQMY